MLFAWVWIGDVHRCCCVALNWFWVNNGGRRCTFVCLFVVGAFVVCLLWRVCWVLIYCDCLDVCNNCILS